MPQPNPKAVDFIWSQAERRLEAQLRQADALDTKAGVLLGVHALAAGLVGSISADLAGTAKWVGISAIVGLLISGLFAFRAFRAQDYDRSPSPEALWPFSVWTDQEVRLRFVSTRIRAIRDNNAALLSKARNVSRSLITLGMIALGVAVATIVSLVR